MSYFLTRAMRIYVVMVISATLVVFAGVPSQASVHPCATVPVKPFAGANTSFQNGIFGARGNIEYDLPSLCGSNGVASVTWVMVTANSVDGAGWAQAGYGNFGSGDYPAHTGDWVFSQTVRSCGTCTTLHTEFMGHPTAGNSQYNSSYKTFDGNMHCYVDGNQIFATGWSPNGAWDPQWSDQFAGETKYTETDVSGTKDDPVAFTDLDRATDGSGNWADIQSMTLNTPKPARYKREFIDPGVTSNFRIWTEPLNSL